MTLCGAEAPKPNKLCKYDSKIPIMKYISIIKCCGSGLMSGSRHF